MRIDIRLNYSCYLHVSTGYSRQSGRKAIARVVARVKATADVHNRAQAAGVQACISAGIPSMHCLCAHISVTSLFIPSRPSFSTAKFTYLTFASNSHNSGSIL